MADRISLGEIGAIRHNIDTAQFKIIKIFHRFLFADEGDRLNRKRIRKFTGFEFDKNSEEHVEKRTTLEARFTSGDITSMLNLLCLDYEGDKKEDRLCEGLMDIRALADKVIVEDEEEEEDENEEDEGADDEVEEYFDLNEGGVDGRQKQSSSVTRSVLRFSLTYKDVEDSIRPFSGEAGCSVRAWIADFEDIATRKAI